MNQLFVLAVVVAFAACAQAQIVDNHTEKTISCENGVYIDGVLQANETEFVNCTTRFVGNRVMNPMCQTKIEERHEGNETSTVVWKTCKTEQSCQMNEQQFNERDCPKIEGKPFRICVSCCDSDNCNESITIDDIAIESPEKEEAVVAGEEVEESQADEI